MAKRRDKKHIKTKSDAAAFDAGCYIDGSIPQKVLNFNERYLNGFKYLQWQWDDVVFPLFAWRMPDGSRRFKTANVFIGRGNGKTYFEAGTSLGLQVVEDHAGEEMGWIGPTTKQAQISFNNAVALIGENESGLFKITNYLKEIKLAGATICVLAADNNGSQRMHGFTGPVVLDELHGQNMVSYEAAQTTANKSKCPLLFTISTAGKARRGVAWEIWQDCLKILQGKVIDIHTLPVVYTLKKVDHWQDFNKVLAINPGVVELGKTEDLRREWQEAINKPWKRPSFLRLRCNIWTKQSGRWLDAEKWIELQEDDPAALAEWDCYLGLDFSKRNDLTGMAAMFAKGDRVYFKFYFWTPNRDLQERAERDELNYEEMAESGDIELVQSDTINHTLLFNYVKDYCGSHNVKKIGFDPALNAMFVEQLESLGLPVLPVYQGGRLTDSVQEFENLIDGGQLSHDGNKVMSYCVENVCLKEYDNKRFPVKENESSKLRIDGVVTALIALKAYLLGDTGKSKKKKISKESFDRQLELIASIAGNK